MNEKEAPKKWEIYRKRRSLIFVRKRERSIHDGISFQRKLQGNVKAFPEY